MKKYDLKEGKDELIRSILLMKYDTKKTLTENKKVLTNTILNEQINTCPNIIDETSLKNKAVRVAQLFNYMTTVFYRMVFIRDRAIEVFNIIDELSKKNFYDPILKTCENSLKRFKMEFEGEYTSGDIDITEDLEEEFNDLINGYIGKTDPVAKTYLEKTLNILTDNINKVASQTPNPNLGNPDPNTPNLKWKDCSKFPLFKGCKSDLVGKVQKCIGSTPDNKFGSRTEAKLKEKGYKTTVDQTVYAEIMKKCGQGNINPTTTTTTTYKYEGNYSYNDEVNN